MRWVAIVSMCLGLAACKDSGDVDPFGHPKPKSATSAAATPVGSATSGSASSPTLAKASTNQAPSVPGMTFKLGEVVDVHDEVQWNEGMITEVSADGYKVLYLYNDTAAFVAPDKVRAPKPWSPNSQIQGMKADNRWYDTKVTANNADGTYDLEYADGEVAKNVPPSRVHGTRKVKRHHGDGAAAVSGHSSTTSSGSPQACVPSHYSRCGNNCFDLQNDRYHCGSCGHSCPSGMGLCNHGQCDCTQYDKDANGGSCPSS